MTTATPESVTTIPEPVGLAEAGRTWSPLRFALAFVVGIGLALAIAAGALYAYDQQYAGRILPGVSVGAVDLSGLDPVTAADRLRQAYAELGEGELILAGPDGPLVVPFADFGRRADVEGMVGLALGVGRAGTPLERLLADIRIAVEGVSVTPSVTLEHDTLRALLTDHLRALRRAPTSAVVTFVEDAGFVVAPAVDGRIADPGPLVDAALAAVGRLEAPVTIELDIPMAPLEPGITTAEATAARDAAVRMTSPISLNVAELDAPLAIASEQLQPWITFAPTVEGGLTPRIDTTGLPAVLKGLAKKIDQKPVNASFTTSGGKITGVTPSQTGVKLDVGATVTRLQALFAERASGPVALSVGPVLTITQPALTTAEARAAQPKMRRISRWTTYFPIGIKNGFGANIWIPARLIDGYVVAPGATFDFWDAVGPVTRAKGYKDGGAIINGRTEPQGALAGGICSCSTTLFNAALRAGYDMGARRNHYYYIDRYPRGLDATVFISASGSRQTMSFTNDTDYPILIRGYGWQSGGSGYVRFDLYSVPTGRDVDIIQGPKRDLRPASDTIQYTSSLPPGVRERIEYPVDGFKTTAIRIVRDKDGNVIHRDTYYSNYARITGIVLVGRGATEPGD
jgi:vancomycin resistance protein YoaR